MKFTKKGIGKFALIFLIFTAGGVLGFITSSYLYYRFVFSNMFDRTAAVTAEKISDLCFLRIGDVNSAIEHLETSVDRSLDSITQLPNIPQTDYRYRILRAAKTYYQFYPSKMDNPSLSEVLKNIPMYEEKEFKCEGPLCRLIKYHSKDKTSD